jgi:hypothetical protein
VTARSFEVQHAALSIERWSAIPLEHQILMIANEMNRAAKLLGPEDRGRLTGSYERVLRLVDLTIEARRQRGLRRELLRWRDLIAALYQSPEPDPGLHRSAFRCLLQLNPVAARQIPFLQAVSGRTSPDSPADTLP